MRFIGRKKKTRRIWESRKKRKAGRELRRRGRTRKKRNDRVEGGGRERGG
jgi:hypothetical protein